MLTYVETCEMKLLSGCFKTNGSEANKACFARHP
jgi:hypothetical protein